MLFEVKLLNYPHVEYYVCKDSDELKKVLQKRYGMAEYISKLVPGSDSKASKLCTDLDEG